ncbi:MAG: Rpn family recombination-promoting nuclease/putative transposase [Muribaculaceae bacterium]|nr:Rpn family recombination-promoting nuclease/putative transposase [Muribaculaceae bacterium]
MEDIKTPYLNIQTDFGFKQVFGQVKNKKALIRFLNILFAGKLTVTDVIYHDKEIIPSEEEGKRIIYDVYCTMPMKKSDSSYFPVSQKDGADGEKDSEHHFILEMQNIYIQPFEERLVFYASKMIVGQGKAGWDYELAPVFAIAVTDFNFNHMSPKLMRDVMLVDRESMEPLTDKVHIFLCSLKEVPAHWEECKTELEEILFLIKNMENMDNTSMAYKEGRYPEIFEAARSSRLRPSDMVEYRKSLDRLRDLQRGIKYETENARRKALEEGRAEGRAEGMAEGMEIGEAKGKNAERRESIRIMISLGISAEKVAEKYQISVMDVRKIAGLQ